MFVSDIKLISTERECELQARVKTDALWKPFLLRYRFPSAFGDLVDPDNGDPFVAALLLPAMKSHEALEIPVPVSSKLLRSTDKIQAIYKHWDAGLSQAQVKAPVRKGELPLSADRSHVGLFFSCGVDSFYTLLKNIESHPRDEAAITHLIVLHGFDLYYGRRNSRVFDTVLTNSKRVGRAMGKIVLPVATNLRDFSDQFVRFGMLYHGAALASVGLALENAFHRIYVASTHSSARLMPWGSHPLLDPLWSTDRLSLVHADIEPSRVDKIRLVVQVPIVLETLRVCTIHSYADLYNCGSCEKCLRTIVGLHIAGALRKCKTLPQSIDVGLLRNIYLRDQNARSFVEELVNALGYSENDLEIRSALEESLSGRTESRIRRFVFWAVNYFAAAYMPSFFPACRWVQRAFSGRSRRSM